MSYLDIIRILLAEHEELRRLKGTGTTPQRPSQQQRHEAGNSSAQQKQNQVQIIDKQNIPWDKLITKRIVTEDNQILGRIDRVMPPYVETIVLIEKPTIHSKKEEKYIPNAYYIHGSTFKHYDSDSLYIMVTKEFVENNYNRKPLQEIAEAEDIEYYKRRYIDGDKTTAGKSKPKQKQQQQQEQQKTITSATTTVKH